MSTITIRPPPPIRRKRSLRRRAAMAVMAALGWLLIAVGLVGAVLPGHLGVPVLLLGLIVVLRSSRQARRQFIFLQRRHPRWVFPIRRLLRRNPQVAAVLWQQLLRTERLLMPRPWRQARAVRRRLFRRGRRPRAPGETGPPGDSGPAR
jgi:hypothetical protein